MCPDEQRPPDSEDGQESALFRERRRLLNWMLGGSVAAWLGVVIYPSIRYLLPPEGTAVDVRSVKLGNVKEYDKNSGTLFRIGNKPGILIRTVTGEFRAFIAICTHLDCTVQFKKDEGLIWCACHNGKYNLQGTNISGPPPRPLTPLVVSLKGDEVYVSFPS
ncbi:MAG: ubiquinol-cytochrome c reductase iron-sulfur subunit [bacterium]